MSLQGIHARTNRRLENCLQQRPNRRRQRGSALGLELQQNLALAAVGRLPAGRLTRAIAVVGSVAAGARSRRAWTQAVCADSAEV